MADLHFFDVIALKLNENKSCSKYQTTLDKEWKNIGLNDRELVAPQYFNKQT